MCSNAGVSNRIRICLPSLSRSMNQAILYNLIDTSRDPKPAHKTSPFSNYPPLYPSHMIIKAWSACIRSYIKKTSFKHIS